MSILIFVWLLIFVHYCLNLFLVCHLLSLVIRKNLSVKKFRIYKKRFKEKRE